MTDPPMDDPIPDFNPIDIAALHAADAGRGRAWRAVAAAISGVALIAFVLSAENVGAMSQIWQGIGAALHLRRGEMTRVEGGQVVMPVLGVSGASHAPGYFNTGAWQIVALPAVLQTNQSIAATGSGAPGTLYFCTTGTGATTEAGPTTLWHSSNAGATWERIAAPLPDGTNCTVTIAKNDPQSVAVGVATAESSDRCGMEAYWLTRDGGLSWNEVTMPPDIPYGVSVQCQLLVTQNHLYLAISSTHAQAPHQRTHLECSDDRGLSWASADGDFGAKGYFAPVVLNGGVLAVNLVSATLQSLAGLWLSNDAGATWHRQGPPVGSADVLGVRLPEATRGPPGFLRLVLYDFTGTQIPSSVSNVRITTSQDGATWGVLPPLPATGATAEHTGVAAPLALTGDGNLIALGADPLSYAPGSQANPAFTRATTPPREWLWMWNASEQHWYVATTPSPLPPSGTCGFCWHATLSLAPTGGWDLWIVNRDTSGVNTLYHVFLSPIAAIPAMAAQRG